MVSKYYSFVLVLVLSILLMPLWFCCRFDECESTCDRGSERVVKHMSGKTKWKGPLTIFLVVYGVCKEKRVLCLYFVMASHLGNARVLR